ncbi:NTP transferase domain-containing protein [bacterium]|nr:NTP transferase domain-containing protein [bacterium]
MENTPIAAVIAAAGMSRRMGEFKQLLPWGQSTVIASVVANLAAAGASPILCVVGHRGDAVAGALAGLPAQVLYNSDYAEIEMLRSYQIGVRSLCADPAMDAPGTLLALGDQPHIPVDVLQRIIKEAKLTPDQLVIPSHQMRRGHPIYLPRRLWPNLLALGADQSLRDLLNRPGEAVAYVEVDTDAIRRDMDYWVDYQALLAETTDDRQPTTCESA